MGTELSPSPKALRNLRNSMIAGHGHPVVEFMTFRGASLAPGSVILYIWPQPCGPVCHNLVCAHLEGGSRRSRLRLSATGANRSAEVCRGAAPTNSGGGQAIAPCKSAGLAQFKQRPARGESLLLPPRSACPHPTWQESTPRGIWRCVRKCPSDRQFPYC
jgi:hypothetical protein